MVMVMAMEWLMQNWRLSERGDHAMGIAGDGPGQQTMFNNAEYVGTEATLKKKATPSVSFNWLKWSLGGGSIWGRQGVLSFCCASDFGARGVFP